ncbi:MAG TPA: class I SAM-dependent methyltransferase, partial [Polyangia bacterium]
MAVELQRSCPVCQATSARPLFHKQGCDFVRCHDCGLTYINPVPAADALAAHYARYGREYFTNREKLRQDFAPQRYGRELAFLRRAGARGRLVDVGCATGSFLAAAQGAGFTSTVGVDIAGPSCAYARSLGLDAREGDFTAGFLDEASADTVAMWATLEHLPDPAAFVAAAGRVLGAGGLLVVSVPNMRSLSQLLLGRR